MDEQRRAGSVRERLRAVPWLIGGAPWWASLVLGAVLLVLGALLFFRPLSALGVLGFYLGASCLVSGVADLLTLRSTLAGSGDRQRRRPTWFDWVMPWLWIVVGLALLVWLGRNLALLVPAVAGLLLVSGVIAVIGLVRDRSADTLISALFGLAEILFGLLALLWPDVTLIVVAVLFGGRTALYGLTLIVAGIAGLFGRPARETNRPSLGSTGSAFETTGPVPAPESGAEPDTAPAPAAARPRSGWLLGLRFVAAACVLLLAIGTTWVSHTLRAGAPVTDAFYDTPDDLPDHPGVLVRWDDYSGALSPGLAGYRIYYTTTDGHGTVVPSTGLLVIPIQLSQPAPLITWAHGTVGVARACAPSLNPDALNPDQVPAVDQLATLGWAMVATDYPGMGAEGVFPYLIGEGQGRAVLDAARAARQLPGIDLAPDTIVWGHSQGGHAALWAGQLAASYAPELHVVGTAALSPASNPVALAEGVLAHPEKPGASLAVSFVVDAYTRFYPDLRFDDIVIPSARTLVREAAARCTGEGGTLVTILAGLSIARDQPIVRPDAMQGPFGERLTANIPRGPWSAPLFIGQGEADEVLAFRLNQAYVAELCSAGTDVEFRGYPGGTHMSVLVRGSAMVADLVAWTADRLAGRPTTPTCS